MEERRVRGDHDLRAVEKIVVQWGFTDVRNGFDSVRFGLLQSLIHELIVDREVQHRITDFINRRLGEKKADERLAASCMQLQHDVSIDTCRKPSLHDLSLAG